MAEYWEILLKKMAKSDGKISKEFLASIESTVSTTDWKAFEEALASGRLDEAIDKIDWLQFNPERLVEMGVSDAANAAADMITLVSKVNYQYDPKMRAALGWVKQYAAEEVKYINPASQQAIREAVYRAYSTSVAPTANVPLIKSMIGLTPSQAKSVENYRNALLKKGKSEEAIQKACDKYAAKRLKQRAETIAVNEASEAACHGHLFATKDAVQRGVIDPQKWEEIRLVTPDERACKICRPLNGETRQLPDGFYASTGSQISKIHTRCRCIPLIREKTKGDSSTMHFDSFKFGGKIIEKTDLITVVPAILTEEGVQNRGLKRFTEFYDPAGLDGYIWFERKPVTRGHPGHKVDNQTPKLGRIRNVRPDPTTKQVPAELELFNAALTKDEMKLVDSGEQIGGSIGYDCGILVLDETKIWEPTGEEYDFEYVGPIYGDHFAIFVDPACKRCGLNTDSKCNCKKELAMTEKPPAQTGTEGAPAQAGTQDDGKKGTVPAPATKKSMKDQAATAQEYLTELIVRAKTILEISDEYTRYREAAAILLEIATDNFVGASALIGDKMKNDALAEFRKELDAQKTALDALKADNEKLKAERDAREQADKARQEDATKAGIKELLLPAAQADFEAKHWPAIKQDGFNAWVARPENAALLAVNRVTGKIEPVGQRFVTHPGADSEDKQFDAGIDAAIKKVR